MSNAAVRLLKGYLMERAKEVRALEVEAEKELHEGGGQKVYEDLMRRKAELLRDLSDDALAQDGVVPDELPPSVVQRLKRFSASAAMSLQVGSVFFMSALLYPEDHRSGEPNDLETFVDML